MSWYLKIAGKDRAKLIERVKRERMPAAIEEEVVRRIESVPQTRDDQVLLVNTRGHVNTNPNDGPYNGMTDTVFDITYIDFYDAPAEAEQPSAATAG